MDATGVQKRYDRLSRLYDRLEGGVESRLFSSWRRELIEPLRGCILEVGVGTGKNLPYYHPSANVVGIDLSPGMLAYAEERLENLGVANITLREMNVEELDYEKNTFDYVLCTFVLCSVPDPISALKEMQRVVKPGGAIMMLEHVQSKYWPIRMFQALHNPITRGLFGFNVNRDTAQNVQRTGLKLEENVDLAVWDVFKRFKVVKNKSHHK